MKKILALLLVMMMAASFAACSGKDGDAPAPAEAGEKEDTTVKGEVYNAGNISALVPEGWKLIEGSDMFQEYTDIGHNPNNFSMYKGATDDFSVFSCCGINIYYYENSMWLSKDIYDEVQDLPEQKIGNYTWQGFTAKSIGYPIAVLYTGLGPDGEATGDQIQVNLTLENGDKKISLDDPDVRAILESIKH